ncbi:hypothetical protein NP493_7311g00000, partial [Ridgeia piscesae]
GLLGLGVNPEEDKLYISDYGRKIVVTSLDGSGGRTLINCTTYPQFGSGSRKSVRSVPLTGETDTIHDTGSYSNATFWGIAILQGDHNCPETVSTGYDNSNVPVEVQCGT